MRGGFGLVLAMLIGACSGQPPGGELKVAVIGEANLADELAAEATSATLLRRGSEGELATGLATSWRFLDEGDALILRLAPLHWPAATRGPSGPARRPDTAGNGGGSSGGGSPGAELVAEDVVNSLRRPRNAAARAVIADAGLAASRSVRAPISRVVEMLPRPPTPFLLDWLAEPALAIRNRRGIAYPGPYEATSKDGSIILNRRGSDATADASAARIIIERPDVASAVRRHANAEVHVVLGAGLAGLGTVRAGASGRALRLEPVHGVIGLAIVQQAALGKSTGGILADPRLRRALLLAADGPAIANRIALQALQAQDRLWDGLPPPIDDRALPRAERLAAAATLLAQAGHGAEQPLQLIMLVPPGDEFAVIARELAGSWAPLGIDLRTVSGARAASAGTADSGKTAGKALPPHDLALQEIIATVPDAVAHLARWRCNRARPCSAQADNLLAEARSAGNDLATRAAAVTAAEAALMADPAFIPLLRPVRWALVASGVTGFRTNTLGRHPLGRMAPPGARLNDPA